MSHLIYLYICTFMYLFILELRFFCCCWCCYSPIVTQALWISCRTVRNQIHIWGFRGEHSRTHTRLWSMHVPGMKRMNISLISTARCSDISNFIQFRLPCNNSPASCMSPHLSGGDDGSALASTLRNFVCFAVPTIAVLVRPC